MKWRLQEGFGEAIYEIGVEDNGSCCGLSEDDMIKSLDTLKLYFFFKLRFHEDF